MIITLIILVTLITLAHKGLMKAVESYEYGHHHKEYNYISHMMYWDKVKNPVE